MSVIFPLCAIDFEPRHLGLLTVSDRVADAYRHFGSDPSEMLKSLAGTSAKVFTITDYHARPLGLMGCTLHFAGCGGGCARAFMVPDVRVSSECPVAWVRMARKLLEHVQRSWGLHRIEGIVPFWLEESYFMLEHLGFEYEGILRKYDLEGNDYYLLARTNWR